MKQKNNYWGVKPLKFNNTWNVKPIKTFDFRLNIDSDRDGVPDWKDCQPFNWHKQHDGYKEFQKALKQNIKKEDIIKVVNGYGIYTQPYPTGEIFYYAMDMNTGLTILNNRPSLEEIVKDIKKGVPAEIKKRFPDMFDVRKTYELEKRTVKTQKKYGGKARRFAKRAGQKVLDIGAGGHPDYRATHAIDLESPIKQFGGATAGIDYKWGYDFDKETTNLPYPNNFFNVVVSYGAFGRNFQSRNIAREIYRVLKKGGHFEFNPDAEESIEWIKKAGFKKLYMKDYFDEELNEKISIVIAEKV